MFCFKSILKMKYSLKFNDLNLYLCSLMLGLLQFMLHSKKYDLGIWSLGMPMFRDGLEANNVDQRLIDIVEIFDELSAMKTLNIDVDKVVKEKIDIILQVMTELSCVDQVNEIIIEKTEQKH